jgi:hypothetical protein
MNEPTQHGKRPPKRAWARPVLVSYGDASTLTLGKANEGRTQDGAGKSKMRTR